MKKIAIIILQTLIKNIIIKRKGEENTIVKKAYSMQIDSYKKSIMYLSI